MDKSRSKKLVRIVLIISAILGVASIATAYYYYQIRDVTPQESSAFRGCACYFVDTSNGVENCSDANPKMAFEFRPGIVEFGIVADNGTCSATCDLRTAPAVINPGVSTTESEESTVIACKVEDFTSRPGCTDIALENADGVRVANSVDPDKPVKAKAVFTPPQGLATDSEDFYESFSFLINGEKTEVDFEDAVKRGAGADAEYTVSTNITDYEGADKLTIQAFGASVVGTEFTSGACLREYTINQAQAPSCSSIEITVSEDTEEPKVEELTIETAGLSDITEVTGEFTLGSADSVAITKDLSAKYLDGTILLDEEFLYDTENFTGDDTFSVLDSETSTVDVSVVLTVDGEEIDSDACIVSEKVNAKTTTDEDTTEEDPTTTEDETDNDEEPADTTDTDTTEDTGETSDFGVSKSASLQCVERTSPNNSVSFTVTVTNNDTAFEDIASITDKLPLGFTYVGNSTEINGSAVADADFVTTDTVGDTQQITWKTEAGWSIDADDTLTIVYDALVGSTALTGSALNEVVVVPTNTPTDPDTVRTEVTIEVAQSCTAPETAIFDSTVARIIFGAMIVLFGAAFYTTSTGTTLSTKVAGSSVTQNIYKGAQMFGWKLTDPRKFFEERSISRLDKKRKSSRRK